MTRNCSWWGTRNSRIRIPSQTNIGWLLFDSLTKGIFSQPRNIRPFFHCLFSNADTLSGASEWWQFRHTNFTLDKLGFRSTRVRQISTVWLETGTGLCKYSPTLYPIPKLPFLVSIVPFFTGNPYLHVPRATTIFNFLHHPKWAVLFPV